MMYLLSPGWPRIWLMSQMQSGVFALVVINMNVYWLDKGQGLGVGGFETPKVGPNNVVCFAGRNALCGLAHVVGINLPAGLLGFIGGAPDFHGDAVHRTIVRTPYGPGDESVGLVFISVLVLGLRGCDKPFWRTEAEREKGDQERTQTKQTCIRLT